MQELNCNQNTARGGAFYAFQYPVFVKLPQGVLFLLLWKCTGTREKALLWLSHSCVHFLPYDYFLGEIQWVSMYTEFWKRGQMPYSSLKPMQQSKFMVAHQPILWGQKPGRVDHAIYIVLGAKKASMKFFCSFSFHLLCWFSSSARYCAYNLQLEFWTREHLMKFPSSITWVCSSQGCGNHTLLLLLWEPGTTLHL